MKGVIVQCLRELVREEIGAETWTKVMRACGQNPERMLLAAEDFDDALVLDLVKATCEATGLSLGQAADAFGRRWMCHYAPRVYPMILDKHQGARELLLGMDDVHVKTTERMPNARPPRFDYEWTDERTLIMRYRSERSLIDFMVGLVRGVGERFDEALKVRKLSDDEVEVRFPG